MEYTVVIGGTERACILGMNNTLQRFPMSLGYCGVGYVEEIGPDVKKVAVGDRVLVYHGGENNVSEDCFECIKTAKKRGVTIDAGFAGHVHTDFKVFENAISCGAVPDIISTDITRFSAYKRGGRYGMTMCMSIAKHLEMSEEDIFRAVTSAPAKTLGKENEWGYLKVGRCADIAVFDYSDEGFDMTDKAKNHIASENGYRCVLTVADGEIVYRI